MKKNYDWPFCCLKKLGRHLADCRIKRTPWLRANRARSGGPGNATVGQQGHGWSQKMSTFVVVEGHGGEVAYPSGAPS